MNAVNIHKNSRKVYQEKPFRLLYLPISNSTNIKSLSSLQGRLISGDISSTESMLRNKEENLRITELSNDRPKFENKDSLLVIGWSYSSSMIGLIFNGYHKVQCRTCQNERKTCVFTGNRTFVNNADALLFHASFLKGDDLPAIRRAQQKWIFFTMETPYHHMSPRAQVKLDNFDALFNMTVTYSRDATLHVPYGKCTQLDSSNRNENKVNYSRGKSRMAAWLVSHCVTASKREKFVLQMKQFIQVDIYGKCGTFSCANKTRDCYDMLGRDYWFYLSFENSFCKDYATEKVFNIFFKHIDIVPVVYGAANYSAMLPPGSFIAAADFNSPEELAKYLIHLSQNATAYNEYFRWRGLFECTEKYLSMELCNYLHMNVNQTSTIQSVSTFWSVEHQCTKQTPTSLPL